MSELALATLEHSGEQNLMLGPDGRMYISWIEPNEAKEAALRFASRVPGEPWSEPRTIASGKQWFVNWADFPAMAVLANGTMAAHWLSKSGPGQYAYDINVAISQDGGQSWGRAIVPHRDGKQTEHGFVSFFPVDDSKLGMVWLDGRNMAMNGHGEGGKVDHAAVQGSMALMYTTIANDGSLGAEIQLDDRVCDCCQTAAAVSDGAVVVVYRDRSETEVRDMSVLRLVQGQWSEPKTLHADGWEIKGCPVNGPSIAAEGKRVAVASFTSAQDTPRVHVAVSDDAGASFGAPILVDDGRPLGRVDVQLQGELAWVSWIEQTEAGAEVRLRWVKPTGERGPATTIAPANPRSAGFPRMALSGKELVLAWRDEGSMLHTSLVALGE